MKIEIPTGSTTPPPEPQRTPRRARRRARRRLDRASHRFARTEGDVEAAVRFLHDAQRALEFALDHPDESSVSVAGVVVPRTAVGEVLASADHDLAVANRRHAAAAAHLIRCRLAASSQTSPLVPAHS